MTVNVHDTTGHRELNMVVQRRREIREHWRQAGREWDDSAGREEGRGERKRRDGDRGETAKRRCWGKKVKRKRSRETDRQQQMEQLKRVVKFNS